MQLAVVAITIIALIRLFFTISQNKPLGYNREKLLPQGHIISVPVWAYRVAMLACFNWILVCTRITE